MIISCFSVPDSVSRESNDPVNIFCTHPDETIVRHDRGYRSEDGRLVQAADVDLHSGPADVMWMATRKFASFRMLAVRNAAPDPAVLADLDHIEQLIVETRKRVDASIMRRSTTNSPRTKSAWSFSVARGDMINFEQRFDLKWRYSEGTITPWSGPDYVCLLAEYARLKKIYAAEVERLFAVGYQVTDAEHRSLKNSIEEARVRLEIARLKLEEHQPPAHARAG